MPKKIDDRVRQLAGKTYAETDLTLSQIAEKFKVSDRTVQTWSVEDKWELQRTAHRESNKPPNVVAFRQHHKLDDPPNARVIHKSDDPLEIATMTIKDLQGEMAANIGGRDMAAIAKELREWVKYRDELLKPKTAKEFADQLIASGVSIAEFLAVVEEHLAVSA